MIAASEVKRRGVSVFEEILEKFSQTVISVRGEKKYVVMNIERYEELRAKELDLAYKEVMEDVANGDSRILSAQEHLSELARDLNV